LKFLQNFLEMEKVMVERELKVKLLRQKREDLRNELAVFHQQDIEKAN